MLKIQTVAVELGEGAGRDYYSWGVLCLEYVES